MADKKYGTFEDMMDIFKNDITAADIMSANISAEISSFLVHKRMSMGLNQTQFGEYMGVSQGMVSKWEGGEYNYTIESLCRIASKLDLDLTVKYIPPSHSHNDIPVSHENKRQTVCLGYSFGKVRTSRRVDFSNFKEVRK